jgi:hypothetical protein
MEMGWKREANVIAERFYSGEIPGFLTKEFVAKDGEFVVLEKENDIFLERGPGKLVISSFLDAFTDVIMVDKTEKTLAHDIKGICLTDGKSIDMKFTISFRIFNSDHLSKNLMGERKKLFVSDVLDETMSCVMCRSILPKMQKRSIRDFAKDEFRDKIKSSIETCIKTKFKDWGLLMASMSINFDVREEACLPAASSSSATCASEAKTQTMNAGEEDATSGLEGERREREVRMELEKKQMQRDMEEAIEALELKEVQEKEKELKESGLSESQTSELEEELENLKKAKEVTERKFYKKELSEDAFERMMEDFEKRIIEIETRLKKEKG